VPSILAHIYWAGLLLPEIVMILFTQSTAVLDNINLNDEIKLLCLLQFFPEVAQNFLSFQRSEKSLSIPGLWPPGTTRKICNRIHMLIHVGWKMLPPKRRR